MFIGNQNFLVLIWTCAFDSNQGRNWGKGREIVTLKSCSWILKELAVNRCLPVTDSSLKKKPTYAV